MNTTTTYSVRFDDASKKFSSEPGLNPLTISHIQAHANDVLRLQGHLFLNEALDMLGLPRMREGQVAGWVRKKLEKNPDIVNFGFLLDAEFVQGRRSTTMLNMNVRPDILDDVFGSVA